ncbi:protein indeterminate-domain 7-like [Wolffia australiana]
MATNRFLCEICGKGFQRDQNLQLHLRGHNLPWKLKQREENGLTRKKVYVCPEATCTHHHPSRALGDLTGIKKHFWRKHGEKRWTCTKCSKKYAVMSDWKAHAKTCGTREYKCSCGTIFSRKDSFATHRSFCEALAEESAKFNASLLPMSAEASPDQIPTPFLSATALLQEAEAGGTRLTMGGLFPWQREESQLTRDFLGVTGESELDLLSMIESSGLGHGLPNFMVSSQPQPWTAQIRDHHQRFP